MIDDLLAFLNARLADEEPRKICGCLDTNHWPPCTPQPWKDQKWREIAAMREIIGQQTSDHAPVESIYGTNCRTCVTWQDAPLADGSETEFGIAIPEAWPCQVARFAVIRWSDHPDYRPEWAPVGAEAGSTPG